MRVYRIKSKQNRNTYQSILLRQALRVSGKTKHNTIANLSSYPEEDLMLSNEHKKINFKLRNIYEITNI